MNASLPYNPFLTGLNNAKVVTGAGYVYEVLKALVGKISILIFVLLLGLPIIYIFGVLLLFKRKKFQKSMRKGVHEFSSAEEYAKFKMKLEELSELTPKLKKVINYNPRKVPFVMRFTVNQMQKMSSTLLTFESWLNSRLSSYNTPSIPVTREVKFRSEQELWKNRNKAYSYWM